jgi:hypothetical protein
LKQRASVQALNTQINTERRRLVVTWMLQESTEWQLERYVMIKIVKKRQSGL